MTGQKQQQCTRQLLLRKSIGAIVAAAVTMRFRGVGIGADGLAGGGGGVVKGDDGRVGEAGTFAEGGGCCGR